MRKNLLILTMAAVAFGAGAQDPEPEPDIDFDFVLPSNPAIKLCAIEESTENPVPFASISVEYADTIITQSTDEMGVLDFTPRSFPLTLTAKCEGMQDVTYGLYEHPEEPLTILMTRTPIEEKEHTTNMISAFVFRLED
ncbi:MAG: hypothetical protein K2H22_07925 [Muribaculaceae bacterium]|nr:hypothetical protein [Muribaculaceae bacterium]